MTARLLAEAKRQGFVSHAVDILGFMTEVEVDTVFPRPEKLENAYLFSFTFADAVPVKESSSSSKKQQKQQQQQQQREQEQDEESDDSLGLD